MKFPFVSCSLLYSKLPEECQAHEEYLINIWWMYEWFLNVELFCLHYASSFYRAPNCRRISMDSSCVLITYLKPWVYPPKGTGREDSSWISELPLDAIKIVLWTLNWQIGNRFCDPTAWEWGGCHSCQHLGTVLCDLTAAIHHASAEPWACRDGPQPSPIPWLPPLLHGGYGNSREASPVCP